VTIKSISLFEIDVWEKNSNWKQKNKFFFICATPRWKYPTRYLRGEIWETSAAKNYCKNYLCLVRCFKICQVRCLVVLFVSCLCFLFLSFSLLSFPFLSLILWSVYHIVRLSTSIHLSLSFSLTHTASISLLIFNSYLKLKPFAKNLSWTYSPHKGKIRKSLSFFAGRRKKVL
jgi:hypothetical protein